MHVTFSMQVLILPSFVIKRKLSYSTSIRKLKKYTSAGQSNGNRQSVAAAGQATRLIK
jgi:hypothetical protein